MLPGDVQPVGFVFSKTNCATSARNYHPHRDRALHMYSAQLLPSYTHVCY